jgi:cell division protein FtsQ
VTTQRSQKSRPLEWEEDTSPDSRFRRVQQVTPLSGRTLPGMPLEMRDPEDDDLPRSRRRFNEAPPSPWWRPSSTWGRVFLGLGVFVILGSFVTAIYMFKTYLERDARFRITGAGDIQATGLNEVTRAEMLPVFGEDIGRNVFFVPLSERRKELEKIPWIERATVSRLLPDQLRVSVVERQPVAFVRQGQKIGLVDSNGVLLSMPASMMTKHHYSFPVVTGIDAGDPLSSRRARMAVYQRLLAELDATGQHLSEQISEIDLTDPEDARILMPEQGADILAHFGDDRFMERYQRYKAHIAEWRQQYPKLATVDLRYDQQVVLEMAPGSLQAHASLSVGDGKPVLTEPAASDMPPSKPAAGVKAAAAPARPTVSKTPSRKAVASSKLAKAKNKKKRVEPKHAVVPLKRQNANNTHPAAAIRQGQ